MVAHSGICSIEGKDRDHVILFIIRRDIPVQVGVEEAEQLCEWRTKLIPTIIALPESGKDAKCAPGPIIDGIHISQFNLPVVIGHKARQLALNVFGVNDVGAEVLRIILEHRDVKNFIASHIRCGQQRIVQR